MEIRKTFVMLNKNFHRKNKTISKKGNIPYTPLSFAQIDEKAKKFADIIELYFNDLTKILFPGIVSRITG